MDSSLTPLASKAPEAFAPGASSTVQPVVIARGYRWYGGGKCGRGGAGCRP